MQGTALPRNAEPVISYTDLCGHVVLGDQGHAVHQPHFDSPDRPSYVDRLQEASDPLTSRASNYIVMLSFELTLSLIQPRL